jgi:hypothetical protein
MSRLWSQKAFLNSVKSIMDRAEWTRQIEAEVAELRRDLAETRTTAPERRSKKTMWNV